MRRSWAITEPCIVIQMIGVSLDYAHIMAWCPSQAALRSSRQPRSRAATAIKPLSDMTMTKVLRNMGHLRLTV